MKPTNIIFYIFILILIGQNSYSQISDVTFDQIFLSDGLSQSIVKTIFQDQRGYLYFGTEDGLNRYDAYSFKVYKKNDSENSLSYNDITSLYEDKLGRLWIGTFNSGLNLFIPEKNQFFRISNLLRTQNSLSNNNINSIFVDNLGVVWVGTDKGLNLLINSEEHSNIHVLKGIKNHEGKTILSNLKINSILQDAQNNIWVGTDLGLFMLMRSSTKNTFKVSKLPETLSGCKVFSIYEDHTGFLWVGTDSGVIKLNPTNDVHKIFIKEYFDDASNYNLINNEVFTICEDLNSKLWLGTNGGGIIILDPIKESFVSHLHDPADKRSISSDNIRSIYRDRSGIMWVGTYGGGINKVSRGTEQFYHYKHKQNNPNYLSHPIIWSFLEDEKNNLWIGTHNGLDKLDRTSLTYKHFHNSTNRNSISNNVVRVITKSRSGNMLIGTNGGGLNIFNPITENFTHLLNNENNINTLSNNYIRSIYEDNDGIIWIGTYGGGLNKYNPATRKFTHYKNSSNSTNNISHNYVRTIVEDENNILWIGTEGGGLNRFDKATEVFRVFKSNKHNLNSLSSNYIFSIIVENEEYLWLGTYGGGINKFNKSTGTCDVYTTANGLPSNSIYGMIKDDGGNFWVSTNNGISKFNPIEKSFKNFNENDGLQNNEFNGGAYYKSESGEFFFGGINGFNSFFPKNIKTNKYLPPIEFTSFRVFNKELILKGPLSSQEKIVLPYTDNVFSIEFAALDFSSPEKNKYAYKLTGVDKDWVYVNAKHRQASYTTLSPGKYVFHLRATNSGGIWNEKEAKLIIEITPPFWRQYWFIITSLLLFLTLLYYLYLSRLKVVRMKVELQTAHNAQLSIMPLSDPQIDNLEISGSCFPAYEVGGDFFDYFWLDSDKNIFGCMIGDVSGKAMKAAITAIMTSGMIISETKSNSSINKILLNVNEAVLEKIEKKMFVSLCICSLNIKEKIFSFANAGMNKPIIISKNKITFLDSDGPRLPLGLVNNVDYLETNYNLNSGDIIILTTDGISEAQNSKRQLYGNDRLEKHLLSLDTKNLSCEEIKNSVIYQVRNFTNSEKQSDDLTILVIRIN